MHSNLTKMAIDGLKVEAKDIAEHVENCRERSLALTKIEEAVHWLQALRTRQESAE